MHSIDIGLIHAKIRQSCSLGGCHGRSDQTRFSELHVQLSSSRHCFWALAIAGPPFLRVCMILRLIASLRKERKTRCIIIHMIHQKPARPQQCVVICIPFPLPVEPVYHRANFDLSALPHSSHLAVLLPCLDIFPLLHLQPAELALSTEFYLRNHVARFPLS